MSCPNFHHENILIAIEDEAAEDFMDCFKGDMQDELQEAIPLGCITDVYEKDGLRSYPGKVVFEVDVRYRDYLYKTVQVIVRSGYYGGLNIDYKVVEGGDHIEKEPKYLDKKVDALCNKIKKIIESYGTPLRRVAVFSNGEAVYEKV